MDLSDENSYTESDNETNSNNEKTSENKLNNIIFHIKYDHNIKLSSIITKIGSMENISKVEEL